MRNNEYDMRAAQFAPFAALRGYEKLIREKDEENEEEDGLNARKAYSERKTGTEKSPAAKCRRK